MKKLSTLFSALLLSGITFAQIPNAGFETWTHSTSGGGYDTPDGWGNTNPYTSLASTYTCKKGTTSPSAGSSYLKLTTENCGVVVPGVAATGNINVTGLPSTPTVTITGGFANTSRPATLNGQWQYMAATGTDQAHIIVFLSKWNTSTNKRDTVAYTDSALTGMAMSWAPFSINLKYYSGKFPDTALIILSSSNASTTTAAVGSYLWADALAFAGSVPSGVITVNNKVNPTVIFPNPASSNASIFYFSNEGGEVKISVVSVDGKTVSTQKVRTTRGENSLPLNIAGLPHGIYSIKIDSELSTEMRKLVIE
ncbi:MAG: Secretion system C-terminal sorting domain [Flavipsychrobacter sp.]|jgi:hypothetical protein|nr:Secretion system C-terminal sorting domain [Flavipsychrobacter sp.]